MTALRFSAGWLTVVNLQINRDLGCTLKCMVLVIYSSSGLVKNNRKRVNSSVMLHRCFGPAKLPVNYVILNIKQLVIDNLKALCVQSDLIMGFGICIRDVCNCLEVL